VATPSYPNERGVRFGDAVAAWKETREARGLPVPEKPPRPKERADYSRDVGAARESERLRGAAREGERLRRKWRDVEECIPWMVRYLEELPATARSARRSYRDWTLRQDGAPAPTRWPSTASDT
jgi:hypothetical protein